MRFASMFSTGRLHDDDRSCGREGAPGAGLHRHEKGHGRADHDGLKKDPFCGHLFAFRGKRAQIVKILFWDGNGLCLFTKRLDRGGFVWPRLTGYEGSITLSPAQLAMLIEGIDWRVPERIWRPALAG